MTFNEFAQQYRPAMVKFANSYNLSQFEKDEVIQKGLIHLMFNWQKVDLNKNLNALCKTVVMHHVKMETRGSRSKYFDSQIYIDQEYGEDELTFEIPTEATQEEDVESQQVNKNLNKALGKMSKDYPEHVTVIRQTLEGKPLVDIAKDLKMEYDKTKDLLRYGIVVLKKQK
jgi:RNA polymerase sigma factor (sigma-70 family)